MKERELGIIMLGVVAIAVFILWMNNSGAPLFNLPPIAAPKIPPLPPAASFAVPSFVFPVQPIGSLSQHGGCGRMSWCGTVA